MQATQTTRQFKSGRFSKTTLIAVTTGILALGVAAVALTVDLPAIGGTEPAAITAPQVSSDELYALEAAAGAAQVDGWQAASANVTSDDAFAFEASLELARMTGSGPWSRQMSADEAFALEASLLAVAQAHQDGLRRQLTSDEGWAIEQAQLMAGSEAQRAGR